MHPGLRTLVLAALAFALSGCATGPAHPGGAAETIFNGRDLTGWNGDPRFWRVEGGSIVGQTTAENALSQNTFIVWEGGTVEDFTLRLQFRVTGGNSGVQYRSRVLGGWSVGGYQADMDAANRYTGMLYDEQGRGIIAQRGQKVVVEPDGRFTVVGTVGDTAALRRSIDMSDWNTLEVSMIGNHIVHRVNGRVTVDVTDNQAEEREDSGILALQIHTGDPMKVEFRDLRLTRLPRGVGRATRPHYRHSRAGGNPGRILRDPPRFACRLSVARGSSSPWTPAFAGVTDVRDPGSTFLASFPRRRESRANSPESAPFGSRPSVARSSNSRPGPPPSRG